MEVQNVGDAGSLCEKRGYEVPGSSRQGQGAVQVHHRDASGRHGSMYSPNDIRVPLDFSDVEAERGRLMTSMGASVHQLVLERGRQAALQEDMRPRFDSTGRRRDGGYQQDAGV